ncbi:MAG: hypothetical protein RQ867_05690 [Mariprofundaceae bacterium]|nr:hypothetical protein [Mariprofundaceae bacterium]
MKLKKLLKKLAAYFDEPRNRQLQTDEGLSRVLKKLKRKEQKLQAAVEQERNAEERELLEQELKIVHSQREKGISLLSETRKGSVVEK